MHHARPRRCATASANNKYEALQAAKMPFSVHFAGASSLTVSSAVFSHSRSRLGRLICTAPQDARNHFSPPVYWYSNPAALNVTIASQREPGGSPHPELMLGRPTLWARIPAPGGFNGSDTIDMLLHNSKTGGFESMTSKRYARRCPTSDQKGGCRPRIRKRGYRGSRKIFAGENIDGKENGEAAGLDERGYSYTQDPRAREDKDHGNRAPIEAKRGSAVYSGI